MKRFLAVAALLLGLVAVASVVACGGGGGSSDNAGGGGGEQRLRPDARGCVGGDPLTLDPALVSDAISATYIVEIFGGLVTIDKDLKIVPDIAESWDVSPDGKIYTFHLRDNVVFQQHLPRWSPPTTSSTPWSAPPTRTPPPPSPRPTSATSSAPRT